MRNAPSKVVEMIRALRNFLGRNDVIAYLTIMCIRLIELHRVLKETGSIYHHCYPTLSHYMIIHFRNEIMLLCRRRVSKKGFSEKAYCHFRYNPKYRPLSEGTPQRGRTSVKGKYRERGLRPEGTPVNDWWTDIKLIHSPTDEERNGNSSEKWQD